MNVGGGVGHNAAHSTRFYHFSPVAIFNDYISLFSEVKSLTLTCDKPQVQPLSFGLRLKFHDHSDSGRIPNPLSLKESY